jgi:nitrite reductase (NO-forming)
MRLPPPSSALALLLLVAACGRAADTPQQAQQRARTDSEAHPDVQRPPASMSHGEAAVGTPSAPAERTAEAPPRSTTRRHKVRLETVHVRHTVAPGVTYEAWTFGSQVPGPMLRVTVGDTVDFTLVNKALMPHSMDFHAAEIAPDRAYRNVMPNDSIHFTYVARTPGAFMYHCGTAPVAAHIANGMYGALIVDPATPRARAKEFVLVQSEFYLGPKTGPDSVQALDWQRMLDLAPDYVVFNGSANLYATHPLEVGVGELVRFYLVNAGPNRVSSFHVVGAVFDRIYLDGFGTPLRGVQTFEVPVGGGMIFETRLAEEGIYPFVSHAFADATKGAVGMLRAGNPTGTMSH